MRFKWVFSWVTVIIIASPPFVAAQENLGNNTPPLTADPAATTNGYFADVTVRGRPIFQVGSLANITAQDRAEVINRRITGVLSNDEQLDKVTIQTERNRQLATLRLNNRVLMTVTEQDAQDYGTALDTLAQDWAEQLNQSLQRQPLAIDVAQRLNTTLRQINRQFIDSIPAVVGASIVVVVTWSLARGVRYGAFTWAQNTEGDRSTEILIGRLGYGAVWVAGSMVALGVLGLDFGTLLGALGLTSVAIGFSLKDVLSNYISGVILLAARPFRLGDQVIIKEYEGTISQIQLRATTLKTYAGSTVYIPNQEVFQASIINHTVSPVRRSQVNVGIDYAANIHEARQIIMATVIAVDGVESAPQPTVLVEELAASTVNLTVYFWVNSRRADFIETTAAVTQAIKECLDSACIEMPTEIYTLLFRQSPANSVSSEADLLNSVSNEK